MAPGLETTDLEFSESPFTSPTELQSVIQPDAKGDKADDEAASHRSRMQRWWDKSISKNLSVHNGYKQTFVLFIKWDDELDQLKVGKEVSDLRDVFEKRFNFTTETVELGLKKASTKLEHAILEMLMEYDDPQNLLIVYYAGHGFYHKDKRKLQLAGTTEDSVRGIPPPEVFWQDAETHLTKSVCNSDILTIMDCCFASDINRSCGENSRVCELLAASHIGRTTEQPGDNSFTRALINSLNHLLADGSGDGAFDTHQLHQEINRRRTDNPSGLWRRLPGNSRHILISPQRLGPVGPDHGTKPSENQEQPKGLLSLQFVLGVNDLSEDIIEELTRHLPSCFNSCKAPVRNIKWLGFTGKNRRTKSRDSFASIVRELMQTNKQIKRQREQLKTVDQDEAYQSSDAVKRKAEEEELPGSEMSKRLRINDSESHSSVE